MEHLGELIALGTAFCWTFTALAFEKATQKAGSLAVNIIRLLLALLFYAVVSMILWGRLWPSDASAFNWVWLSISGLVGFVFGDYFLFKSYEEMSARISMLILSLSPPFAALISWFTLGETLNWQALLAMAVTLGGIMLVVTEKGKMDAAKVAPRKKIQLSFSPKGILFAFLGMLGQAVGLVLSKYGMGSYNAFAATQIRVIAGSVGFILLITFIRRWPKVKAAVQHRSAMQFMLLGAILGPFLGVYLSLLALQYTSVGIASTLMATIPVLIIPPAIYFNKEKVSLKEIIGALITVAGVVLFFV